MQAISDIYSGMLLSSNYEPVFHNYYNVEFKDGFAMPMHSHEYIEIMYARRGSCQVYAGESKYKLEPGDFILINGSVPHKLFVSKENPCRVLCLEFDFKKAEANGAPIMQVLYGIEPVSCFINSKRSIIKMEDTEEVFPLLNDICRELEHDEPGKSIYVQSAFKQLVIKLARLFAESENDKRSAADRYIKDAIAYMHDNYHEELNIKQIAEHLNLNISYFYKIFKKVTGRTPTDFLTGIRVKKAENLLGMTDLPVIDVAGIAGFNSRQYFNYVFKKHTGLTPLEYRRSYKIGINPASEG